MIRFAGGLPFYSSTTPPRWWNSAPLENDAFDSERIAAENTDPSQAVANVETTRIDGQFARHRAGGEDVLLQHRIGVRFERQELILPPACGINSYEFEDTYLCISLSWLRYRWSRRNNYRDLGRTEDIDPGTGLSVETGPDRGHCHEYSMNHDRALGTPAPAKVFVRRFMPVLDVLVWARHRHAERYLGGVTFAELSFQSVTSTTQGKSTSTALR